MTGKAIQTLSDLEIMLLDPVYEAAFHEQALPLFNDQRWRLDNLYKIINADGQEVQFRLNLVQKLLLLGMWYCNVILKSRQHGITTFICLFFLDLCLWLGNVAANIIAHNLEDAENFFHRNIHYPYQQLPPHIRANVKAERSSTRELRFSNGSSIRVTTSGRSGTYQLLHVSELGKICAKYPEKAREIMTGALNTVHGGNYVFIESTAEGREGPFYDICQTAEKLQLAGTPLTRMDFKFFFFPWFINPLNELTPGDTAKTITHGYQKEYLDGLDAHLALHPQMGVSRLTPERRAWYVKRWATQGDDMKREHPSTPKEAWEQSTKGAIYAQQFVIIRKEKRIGKVPFVDGALVDTWWDIGLRDETAIWFTQDVGREIHVLRYFEQSGEGVSYYKALLDRFAERHGYRYGTHNAPHDIGQGEWGNDGKTRLQQAAQVGIKFNTAPRLSKQAGINNVRNLLSICWFDEEGCTQEYAGQEVGLASLEQYRREWDDRLGAYKDEPLHNWASHGADAFRTMGNLHRFRSIFEQRARAQATTLAQDARGIMRSSAGEPMLTDAQIAAAIGIDGSGLDGIWRG